MKTDTLKMKNLKNITILFVLLLSFTCNFAETCPCTPGFTPQAVDGTNLNGLSTHFRQLDAGESLCINVTGGGTAAITGAFDMRGGDLYFCSTDGTEININNITFATGWGAQSGNVYFYTDIEMTSARQIYSISWHNYETFTATQDISLTTSNAGGKVAEFINYASGTVSSTKDINTVSTDASIINYGTVSVKNVNSSGGATSKLINYGTFTATSNITRAIGETNNYGEIIVGNALTLGGGGVNLNMTGGIFRTKSLSLPSGIYNVDAGSCAVFYVTGQSDVACGLVYNGLISVVDITPATGDKGHNLDKSCAGDATIGNYSYSDLAGASTCAQILPVDFVDVYVIENVLYWTTATEKDNEKFIIQRSLDAQNYQSIGEVKGAENSNHEIQYLFEDENPVEQTAYYRIKQVDINGRFTYSKVVIKEGKEIEITLYPNPVYGSDVNISINNIASTEFTYEIISSIGEVVLQENVLVEENVFERKIAVNNLIQGIYLVKVKTREDVVIQKMIIE